MSGIRQTSRLLLRRLRRRLLPAVDVDPTVDTMTPAMDPRSVASPSPQTSKQWQGLRDSLGHLSLRLRSHASFLFLPSSSPALFLSFPFLSMAAVARSPLSLSVSNQRAPRSGSQDLAPACMALACAAMDLHHPIRRRRPLWLKIKTSGSMSRALSSYCIMRCEMYTYVPPSTGILWTPH